ncbi:MAG: CusA/CzcA family heavy metal efflux RND transporter [Deltaproteobacteria bacterium]|nr:CusA/CzcA family heavy metal efflux RND transporter [Deltaproteobacteria bacterium]
MVETILAWSLKNRFLVIVLAALLVAGGVRAAQQLPIDAVPDITNVQVQILTQSPALGPEQVETLITTPVELALSGTPRLTELRSVSKFGLSVVTAVFEDGTDIYLARQLVNERLQEARDEIPEGLGSPVMGPITTGLGEIFQFELRAIDPARPLSAMELRSILEFEVSPRLRAVPGVVEVNPFGGELQTYEVQLRPEQLTAYGVAVGDVYQALARNNGNAGGAYIEHNGEQYLVRGEGLIASLDDIRDVIVRTDDGAPVYVRQVATVAFAPTVRQGAVTRDGRGEIVSGTVMMLQGANSRAVTADVKAAIAAMAPSLRALGVEVDAFYDRTELVSRTVRTVATNLIEGGILVMLVLFIMLRSLQAGVVVATMIPLALLAAFLGMREAGLSGNLMSLGAIDFGVLVDGAVILVENSLRMLAEEHHRLGRPVTRGERDTIVARASREVIRSAAFGVAIIAIVYLPILALEGVEGKTFRPMAMTVLFALAGALALSMTLIPVLASWLLPRAASEKPSIVIRGAQRVYQPSLRAAMARPWAMLALLAALVIGTGAAARTLGTEFVPTLDEGSLIVEDLRLPSVSLEESVRRNGDIERVLRRFPEVATVVCKTGRPEIGTDPMSVSQTDVYIMLAPPEAWRDGIDKAALIAEMDAALRNAITGEAFGWSQPIEMRMSELIAGVRADVAVKIYGDDLGTLARTAERVAAALARVPGAADVKAAQTEGLPVLRIDIDRRAIARYGINAEDVLDVVAAIGGHRVGTVIDGHRRFAIQARFAPSARADLAAVAQLTVRTPAGALVPIGQLAELRIDDGPAEIAHEQGRRFITVQANVRDRDLGGFAAEAQDAVARADVIPAGYYVAWGGQFQNLQAASARLAIAVPIALGLIFVLLVLATRSVGLAGLIYLNVPFAVTGGILALAVRGMPFSITAGVGFIALFGVAVLDGLVLVAYMQQRRRAGATAAGAAIEAAHVRLRPVLTAALVAALGFVPMALASGAGAEVQKPLATVVIGGLITSTILTLLVLPTLYAWTTGRRKHGVGELAP